MHALVTHHLRPCVYMSGEALMKVGEVGTELALSRQRQRHDLRLCGAGGDAAGRDGETAAQVRHDDHDRITTSAAATAAADNADNDGAHAAASRAQTEQYRRRHESVSMRQQKLERKFTVPTCMHG